MWLAFGTAMQKKNKKNKEIESYQQLMSMWSYRTTGSVYVSVNADERCQMPWGPAVAVETQTHDFISCRKKP